MFIRQTKTRSKGVGESYYTYRIVESRRVGKKVSQHTLLNLGANFDLPAEVWPELCTRIEQILNSQEPLFAVDASIEKSAQHIYSQIIARRGELQALESMQENPDFEDVDISSLNHTGTHLLWGIFLCCWLDEVEGGMQIEISGGGGV